MNMPILETRNISLDIAGCTPDFPCSYPVGVGHLQCCCQFPDMFRLHPWFCWLLPCWMLTSRMVLGSIRIGLRWLSTACFLPCLFRQPSCPTGSAPLWPVALDEHKVVHWVGRGGTEPEMGRHFAQNGAFGTFKPWQEGLVINWGDTGKKIGTCQKCTKRPANPKEWWKPMATIPLETSLWEVHYLSPASWSNMLEMRARIIRCIAANNI